MKEQELKEIYFGFYDQLIEPYCTEAKELWDYKTCEEIMSPRSLKMSLNYGFEWEDIEKWRNLYDNTGKYLKPTTSHFKEVAEGIKEELQKLIKYLDENLDKL